MVLRRRIANEEQNFPTGTRVGDLSAVCYVGQVRWLDNFVAGVIGDLSGPRTH